MKLISTIFLAAVASTSAKQFVSYDDKHVTGDVKDVALFDADEELIESGADEIASKTDKKKSSKSKESKSKDSKKSKKSSKSKSSRSSRSSRSSSSSSSSSGSGSGSFDSQDCRCVDGDFPNIICEVIWTDVCSGNDLNADEEQLCDEVNSEGCNFDMEMAVNPSLRGHVASS